MAAITLTVDDSLVPRILAAYQVNNAAQLKAAIISDVKTKVIRHEYIEKQITEQENVRLAEEAALLAVEQAKIDAESQIILT